MAFAVAIGLLLSGSSVPVAPGEPAGVEWITLYPYREIDEDPWVRAVRMAQVEHVAAVNAADFSSYRLRRAWPEHEVRRFIEESERALRDGTAEVHVGPMPFTALHVEQSDDGRRALVLGCAGRPARLQEQVTIDEVEWPTPATFTVELFEDGFRRVVDSTVGPLDEPFLLPAGSYFGDDEDLTPEACGWIRSIHTGAVVPVPDLYALMEKDPEDVVLPIVDSWGHAPPSSSHVTAQRRVELRAPLGG